MIGNEIGAEGVKAMSEMLKTNTTLTSLNLYCEEGRRYIKEKGERETKERIDYSQRDWG